MGFFYIIGFLLALLFTVTTLFVARQRCGDFGWTGWLALLLLVPYVGGFFHLALFVIPGTTGPNKYGPDPRQ